MNILPILLFLAIVAVTFALAEKKAPLPPVARPARRAMFASATVGALGIGGCAYTLVHQGPVWQIIGTCACALAGFTGILLAARSLRRALLPPGPPRGKS